jgi:hypothetical protein
MTMYTHFSLIQLLIITVIGVAAYYAIVSFAFRKKLATAAKKGPQQLQSRSFRRDEEAFPEALIDRPLSRPSEEAYIDLGERVPQEEPEFEWTNDGESVLLKEAENVVEEIQDVVNHIASSPANPEEVFTKIKAIVNHYDLFKGTEYYDAINTFIFITVKRDCNLEFSSKELDMLWLNEAA